MIEIEKPRIETEEMTDTLRKVCRRASGARVRHHARQLAAADPALFSSGRCGDVGPDRRRFA